MQTSHASVEAELRAQIQQLTQAAIDREAAIGDKVQSTTQEVEAAFDQLQGTSEALAEKESQAQDLSEFFLQGPNRGGTDDKTVFG